MSTPKPSMLAADPQLQALLVEYLEAVEQGQSPDRQGLLDRHPQQAAQLAEFFANCDQLQRLAAPLRQVVQADVPRSPGADQPTLGAESTSTGTTLRYFGDYELEAEIARGGMGVVYRARQTSLNRTVALKMILSGHLASGADVQRFRAEAEAAARLDHPGIVPIFEVGEQGGQHYFSMAYVDGHSLADLVREGTLAATKAAGYVRRLAETIHYAHQQGVLHRDLKPSNVLVDRQEQLRITDFGLAKQLHGASELTGTGQVLGTPSYMSPEQAAGKTRDVGTASDIYSLGAILYELLTGRPPFRAESPLDTLLQVIHEEPASPRLLNASIPRDLDTICLKCLHKEPDSRYRSAQELAEDLGRFLDGDPIRAHRAGPIEHATRWLRKQRRSVALTAASATAAALLIVVGLLATAGYRKWQLGLVYLTIDNPPPVAELFQLTGEPVGKPISLPTQEPLPVDRGEYLLRISAPRRLSETMLLNVDRGGFLPFNVGLGDRQLLDALNVPHAFELLDQPDRTDLVLLSPTGFERIRPGGLKEAVAVESFPAWDWTKAGGHYSWMLQLHPKLLKPAPDLNDDATADWLFAGQHAAWLLAYSGKDHTPLWTVDRSDASKAKSALLGLPAMIPDVDQDGRDDLAATFIAIRDNPKQPQRWIEAFSAATGKSLWRCDLAPDWFEVANQDDVPVAMRWYTTINGYGGGGGGSGTGAEGAHRTRGSMYYYGDWSVAPLPCELRQIGGKRVLIGVAGERLLLLDPASGQSITMPRELGILPARAPQLTDLDGDGSEDLVVLERRPMLINGNQAGNFAVSVTALSSRHARHAVAAAKKGVVTDGSPAVVSNGTRSVPATLWSRSLDAEWVEAHSYEPLPVQWPVLADLNGDGRVEILVPNASSRSNPYQSGGWGELEALDGRTGTPLWTRRLKVIDQQIDHFVVSDDLDGDGWREVLAATLYARQQARPEELYVDCLSGRDGSLLWWSREKLTGSEDVIRSLRFWEPGSDGAPLVLISLAKGPALFAFSSRTGRPAHLARGVSASQLADVNGDGLSDLISFRPNDEQRPDAGGQIDVIAAAPTELWRRLAASSDDRWRPGGDYDGDSIPEVVGAVGGDSGTAISGRTGRRLWRSDAGGYLFPLSVDLNGDQIDDVLATAPTQYFRKQSPLAALSGKDGRQIWSTDVEVKRYTTTMHLEARDLDRDGKPEIVFVAAMDLDFPLNRTGWTSNDYQLWLRVVSGRDGRVRWRQPLSPKSPALNLQAGVKLTPVLADLNGDRTLDVLAPVYGDGLTVAWQAMDGHSGEPLWDFPLPTLTGVREIHDLPRGAADDLDGDGETEVVVQVLKENESTAGWILEGRSGQVRAPFVEQTARHWHDYSGKTAFNHPQPLILRQAGTRERLVCTWFWSSPGRIMLRDPRGQEVRRIAPAVSDHCYRVWAADLNGDEADELLFEDQGQLTALDPASPEPRWKWRFPQAPRNILIITPGSPPIVVVRSGPDVYGLSGDTGQLAWHCPGPQSPGADWPLPMSLLSAGNSTQPPLVLFQSSSGVFCNRVARGPGIPKLSDAAGLATELSPASTTADPRYTRPLPWARGELNDSPASVLSMIAESLLALLLYVVPAVYVYRLVRDRSWSLRTWLFLPAVAGLILLALRLPLKQSDLGDRLLMGLQGLPLVMLVGVLAMGALQRRWRSVLRWLTLLLSFSILAAVIALIVDSFRRQAGDQYNWTGWHLILLYAAYGTGLIAVPVLMLNGIYNIARQHALKKAEAGGQGPQRSQ